MVHATKPRHDVPEEFDEDPIPWWVRVGRMALAVVAIIGMVYLSGAHEFFLLQRTPPAAQQQELPAQLDAAELSVPVRFVVLTGTHTAASTRTDDNVRRLFENTARVWEQANITLRLESIDARLVTDEEVVQFTQQPRAFMLAQGTYDPSVITVYLVGVLGGGVNGLSYTGTNAVSVADFTSVPDWRTLAHEIGHALGLDHVAPDRGRLMFRGAEGVELTLTEIETARSTARQWQ